MENVIDRARALPYTSLTYVDSDELHDATLFMESPECIILYKQQDNRLRVYWGSTTKEAFLDGIQDLCTKLPNDHLYIEFIPESFVEDLESLGFAIVSEFLDFWKPSLEKRDLSAGDWTIRPMESTESLAVSHITTACRGSSRGFMGEDEAFIIEWAKEEHSIVFVAQLEDELVGMCCLNLYGFDSEKGTVLWLREIAVSPKHQGKGIGRAMLTHAINWGIEQGAKRSFLACDVDNTHAIALYERFGYRRATQRGQINMEWGV